MVRRVPCLRCSVGMKNVIFTVKKGEVPCQRRHHKAIKLGKQNSESLRNVFITARKSLDQTAPDTEVRSAALLRLADIVEARYARTGNN